MTILVTPLIIQANCNATRSIQPQRRGRPVVAPNSFPPFLTLPRFISKFCRKRTATNPGAIGFGYTNHIPDLLRRYAKPIANTCRNCIGRGNKRKCTKINVEHTSLRTFCQYFFPCLQLLIYKIFTINNIQLFQKLKRFKKFFFPGRNIFIKRIIIQQPLVFQPQFNIGSGKIFIQ